MAAAVPWRCWTVWRRALARVEAARIRAARLASIVRPGGGRAAPIRWRAAVRTREQVRQREAEAEVPIFQAVPCVGYERGEVGDAAFGAVQRGAAGGEQVGQREAEAGARGRPAAGGRCRAGWAGRAGRARRGRGGAARSCAMRCSAAGQAGGLVREVGGELGAARDRQLGGGGRRGRAAVGDEVDQRRVGLVPDGRDQRDAAGGGGAEHDLLVEGHQVFQAAAAAGDDQHVGPGHGAARARARRSPAMAAAIRCGGALALHRHRPEQDAAGEAAQRWWSGCPGSPRPGRR